VLVTLRAFPKTDVAQKAAEAVALAPNVKAVVEVDLLRYLTGLKKFIVPLIRPKIEVKHTAKVVDFRKEMAKHSTELAFEDSKTDRVAAYFHTGGTTGMPKVAQHRYSGIVYNAWLGARLLFTETDVQICPLPMFHVFAAIVSLGASLGSGAHVVFPTPQGYRGDGVFDNFWKLIERHKVTFMITVPTALSALMQRPVGNADISSLRIAFCGSSPLPLELYKRFEKTVNDATKDKPGELSICEGYGLTEATCLVSINPPDGEKRVGSIGLPFPYTDVRIVSVATQLDCGVDEIGEICVASPGVYDGKTYTETDKNKGQPDAHAGEVPCAYVELVDGANVTAEDLMAYAKDHIHERAAHPKHLELMDELPKTAVGKIFKPDLRKRAITRIFNEALAAADVAVTVQSVTEDKKRGLVTQLKKTGDATQDDVTKALGSFTNPWDLVD